MCNEFCFVCKAYNLPQDGVCNPVLTFISLGISLGISFFALN